MKMPDSLLAKRLPGQHKATAGQRLPVRVLGLCLLLGLCAASQGAALTRFNAATDQSSAPRKPFDHRGTPAADEPAPGKNAQSAPRWEELTAEQQQRLKKFAQRWNRLPAGKRRHLLTLSRRWEQMTPQQRKKARRHLRHWQQLPPQKRRQIRQRLLAFEHLPPQKRRALIRNWRRFQQLPPEKRRELRQAFEKAAARRHNKAAVKQPAARTDADSGESSANSGQ
jgi:DNA-directed RNA polymerase subunit F